MADVTVLLKVVKRAGSKLFVGMKLESLSKAANVDRGGGGTERRGV